MYGCPWRRRSRIGLFPTPPSALLIPTTTATGVAGGRGSAASPKWSRSPRMNRAAQGSAPALGGVVDPSAVVPGEPVLRSAANAAPPACATAGRVAVTRTGPGAHGHRRRAAGRPEGAGGALRHHGESISWGGGDPAPAASGAATRGPLVRAPAVLVGAGAPLPGPERGDGDGHRGRRNRDDVRHTLAQVAAALPGFDVAAWPQPVVGRGKWLTLIELFGSHRAARTVA